MMKNKHDMDGLAETVRLQSEFIEEVISVQDKLAIARLEARPDPCSGRMYADGEGFKSFFVAVSEDSGRFIMESLHGQKRFYLEPETFEAHYKRVE